MYFICNGFFFICCPFALKRLEKAFSVMGKLIKPERLFFKNHFLIYSLTQ